MTTHLPALRRRATGFPALTSEGVMEFRLGSSATVAVPIRVKREILQRSADAGLLETGGGLYAADPSEAWTSGDTITIDSAGAPGRSFKCARGRIDFDPVEIDEAQPRLLGMWHSHPRSVARLSTGDLECFTRMRRNARRPPLRFVALIAAPDDPSPPAARGWKSAHLRAWVIGRGWYQRADLVTAPDPDHHTTDAAVAERDRQHHVSTRRPRRPATQRRETYAVMIAQRTFRALYGGEMVTISKGERILDPEHELLARFPDAFKRA